GVAEDAGVESRRRGAEPRHGGGRWARFQAVHPVGIGPLVGAPPAVQPARPRRVVSLGAGAHLPAAVTEALHARRTCSLEKLRLGGRVGAGRIRDLGGLGGGELAGAQGGARGPRGAEPAPPPTPSRRPARPTGG